VPRPAGEPSESRPRGLPWLWISLGGAAVGVLAALAPLLLSAPEPAPPAEAPAAAVPAPPRTAAPLPPPTRETEDSAAKLFAEAEAFERANPGEHERILPRWSEVFVKFPASTWARKAELRHAACKESIRALLEREFSGVRKDAGALAAAGEYADAVETVKAFLASQSSETLRRHAGNEIAALENLGREAWNLGAAEAQELAKKGDYPGARKVVEELRKGALPDVAARCDAALARLREAGEKHRLASGSALHEAAHQAFRQTVAPRILERVRERRYDEALRELDAAAALPEHASLREALAEERAAIAAAAQVWEAFLRTLKARIGQDVVLVLAPSTRQQGRLSRVAAERALLETPEGEVEAPLVKVQVDQVIAWSVGRTLPAEEPETYVKAALFLFAEGLDAPARTWFATARERGLADEKAERVFREGFLRAAAAARPAK
jgi:hypothetical protein